MTRSEAPATILQFGYADQKIPSGRSTLLVTALQREGFPISSLLVNPRSRAKSIQLAINIWRARPAQFLFLRFPYFRWMFQCATTLKRRFGARLIVDAMVSAYGTIVEDRKLYSPKSKQALACREQDLLVGEQSDILVADTHVHAKFLATRFNCDESKMVIVPVGSPLFELTGDTGNIAGTDQAGTKLTILYVGSFVPLHGVEVIIEAARILSSRAPNVCFKFVGAGQDYNRARDLAPQVQTIEFLGVLSRQQSIAEILKANIVLGIFGSSEKAATVVPFKVYDALAFGKPVITARTPATEELLRHGENSWLISPEPGALATAIEELAADQELRSRLAIGARKIYDARFHSSVSVRPLVQKLNAWTAIRS